MRPGRLRAFASRLRELFLGRQINQDLQEELREHLALAEAEHRRRGLSPDAARRAAQRDLGGLEQTAESVRDRRGFRVFEYISRDARYAARLLRKAPGFTVAATATIALGIGANVAVFTLADAALFRPWPYPEPDRLVALWETYEGKATRSVLAAANFIDYERENQAFDTVAVYQRNEGSLSGSGSPERIAFEFVSVGYFPALKTLPVLGRPFGSQDYVDGHAPVAIISDAYWQSRLGGAANVLDQSIVLDERARRVIGVMPRGFRAVSDVGREGPAAVWLPSAFRPDELTNRNDHEWTAIGRVRAGVSLDQAQLDLARISAAIARNAPEPAQARAHVAPLADEQVESLRPLLLLLLGAAGAVMLIACVNVAGLIIVRALARRREVAVRLALGATRGRLAVELLVQSAVLVGLGTTVGLAAGWVLTRWLASIAPVAVTSVQPVGLDIRAMAVAGGLAIATALLFGLLPLRQFSGVKPVFALGGLARGTLGPGSMRGRQALLVLQLALGVVLAVGAGLMIRSAMAISAVPLGFNPDNVVAASVALGGRARYPTLQSRIEFFETLRDRIASLPGVRAVAYGNQLPLRGSWTSGFIIEPVGGEARVQASAGFQSVSAEYFDVFGIPLAHGRLIEPGDRTGQSGVALVNGAFGRALLAGTNPIGRVIRRGPVMPPIRIVGVVGDVRRGGRLADIVPQVYLPATQPELYSLQLTQFAVSTHGDAPALTPAIRAAVWAIDPDLPITNVRTIDETLALQLGERRFQTWLFSLFGAIALVLTTVGIYGVVSYAVGQRTPEIGLRLALGAGRGRVLALMLRQSMILAALGSAIGLAAAYGLSRYMTALVWQVSPTDPVSYLQAAAVMIMATLAASLFAARRATRVEPSEVLR